MPLLKFLTPNILQTCKRFPLSILCCLVMFAVSVFEDGFLREISFMARFCLCGFFVFAIARLAAETRGWNSTKEAIVGIGGTFLFYAILDSYGSFASYLYIFGVFITALSVVPFLNRKADDVSYWNYQQKLAGGAILAVISAMIFVGGILIALMSMKYLFEMNIPNDIYKYLWYFTLFVYGPFNMLSWIPYKFEVDPAECHAGPGLPFILNWILAPLAFLYFLILYGYGAKILIEWELPRGMIVYMVSGFGGLGILIYIAGWIMRDTGSKLLQYLYKHFFSLLILPVVLLFVAIYMRIDQYGLTQDRYMVVLAGVWMGGMALLFTFKPAAPLKIILGSLMVLMFIASYGPWGAISLSDRSQMGRLKAVLERNNMLENGTAVAAKGPIPFEDQSQISSIVEYFSQNQRAGIVSRLIPQMKQNKRNGFNPRDVLTELNVRYVSKYDRRRMERNPDSATQRPFNVLSFHARSNNSDPVNVTGYDVYVQYFSLNANKSNDVISVKDYSLPATPLFPDFKIRYKKGEIFAVPGSGQEHLLISGAEMSQLTSSAGKGGKAPAVIFEGSFEGVRIKMIVKSANFHDYGNGETELQNISGELFLSK